jgi:UrcA family protein
MNNAIKCLGISTTFGLCLWNSVCCASVQKAPGEGPAPTKIVSYSDLDLDSEAGARTLYVRLRAASRQVCTGFEGTESVQQHSEWLRCYSTALSSAVSQVNSASLSSLYHQSQVR